MRHVTSNIYLRSVTTTLLQIKLSRQIYTKYYIQSIFSVT